MTTKELFQKACWHLDDMNAEANVPIDGRQRNIGTDCYQAGFLAAAKLLKERLNVCAMERIGPGDAVVGAGAVLLPFIDLLP